MRPVEWRIGRGKGDSTSQRVCRDASTQRTESMRTAERTIDLSLGLDMVTVWQLAEGRLGVSLAESLKMIL